VLAGFNIILAMQLRLDFPSFLDGFFFVRTIYRIRLLMERCLGDILDQIDKSSLYMAPKKKNL
jgi:hypothetical protein